MLPTYPLPLHHSWALADRHRRFDAGLLLDGIPAVPASAHATWRCRLVDEWISWSDPVFRFFGLPVDAAITRPEIIGFYAEPSRAALERLRSHAIRHRRGFTLDVELRPATSAGLRWMRIIAAPVCAGGQVTAIEGIKLDVSALYR